MKRTSLVVQGLILALTVSAAVWQAAWASPMSSAPISTATSPQYTQERSLLGCRSDSGRCLKPAKAAEAATTSRKSLLLSPLPQGAIILVLDPLTLTVTPGTEFTMRVVVDTGTQPIDAAQLTLTFPPNYLEVVSTTPGTSLPDVFQQEYSNSEGVVRYAAGRLFGDPPQGQFEILQIQFRAVATTAGAEIRFSSELPLPTKITHEGQNLVISMVGSVVTISQNTATPTMTSSPTPTPSPTATEQPTWTPGPTSTPEPTSTQVAADTPQPTGTISPYPPPGTRQTPTMLITPTPSAPAAVTETATSPAKTPPPRETPSPTNTPAVAVTATKEARPSLTPPPTRTTKETLAPQTIVAPATTATPTAPTTPESATEAKAPQQGLWSIVAIVAIVVFVLGFALARRKWFSGS